MKGKHIPDFLEGYGRIKPFKGLDVNKTQGRSKRMPGLRAAIEAAGLKDAAPSPSITT